MKMVLRIFSKLITLSLVVILLISLYVMVSSRITGGQPSIMGNQLMLVLSGSMEPNIQTGSVVGIKPIENLSLLNKGDIITFYSPIHEDKRIITHRIKEVRGQGDFLEFITQGDNNPAQDPMPVPAHNVIGKFSGIDIPYAGYILKFLQSKKGIALSLIIPSILIIIYNSFVLWRIFRVWDPSNQVTKENPNNQLQLP
ncbi:signal peptidase I [Bacillus sp. FJAT-27245]|uniref:signal peptidase I n=1 Tax=Bacillus sp. FJAT-27245 TaxID=1684144 RepID=UPI0006A7EA04|nr:signal peptidase I [Bacillus sp. FJAT-27245]